MSRTIALFFLAALNAVPHLAPAVVIPTVHVGNAGNANDPATDNRYGDVAYEYSIGTTEVTNAQYVEFLNAKATTGDPLGLYDSRFATDVLGGISRNVSNGVSTYFAKANRADKPVNFISWYDAIRFANWLNNGQGAGDTETGAYTLLGGTPTPSNGLTITRNVGATWFVPSEDEWYKAAYYDATLAGGSGGYWEYATRSNTAPTMATIDSVGNISNPGANVATYDPDFPGNLSNVGSAGPLSKSYYGTSDQSGNVWEWMDEFALSTFRKMRGGSYDSPAPWLSSSTRGSGQPQGDNNTGGVGFRVATLIVPEPSSIALAAVALVGLVALGRRKRACAH